MSLAQVAQFAFCAKPFVDVLQYLATPFVYNFGYSFRAPWYLNYAFLILFTFYTAIQFCITLYPSHLSCLYRVNCNNDEVTYGVYNRFKVPIQNYFNTTLMPMHFRWILVAIMASNFVTLIIWEVFGVNGLFKRYTYESGKGVNPSNFPGAEDVEGGGSDDAVEVAEKHDAEVEAIKEKGFT